MGAGEHWKKEYLLSARRKSNRSEQEPAMIETQEQHNETIIRGLILIILGLILYTMWLAEPSRSTHLRERRRDNKQLPNDSQKTNEEVSDVITDGRPQRFSAEQVAA